MYSSITRLRTRKERRWPPCRGFGGVRPLPARAARCMWMREAASGWRARLPSLKHARLARALGFEVLPPAFLYAAISPWKRLQGFFYFIYLFLKMLIKFQCLISSSVMLSQFWLPSCCMLSWECKITSLGIRYRFQPGFQGELQLYHSLQKIIQIVVVTQSGYVT